jgi:hypothetical protein
MAAWQPPSGCSSIDGSNSCCSIGSCSQLGSSSNDGVAVCVHVSLLPNAGLLAAAVAALLRVLYYTTPVWLTRAGDLL